MGAAGAHAACLAIGELETGLESAPLRSVTLFLPHDAPYAGGGVAILGEVPAHLPWGAQAGDRTGSGNLHLDPDQRIVEANKASNLRALGNRILVAPRHAGLQRLPGAR